MPKSNYATPIEGTRARLQSIKAEEKMLIERADDAEQRALELRERIAGIQAVLPEWVAVYRSLGGECDDDGQPYTAVDPHAGEREED